MIENLCLLVICLYFPLLQSRDNLAMKLKMKIKDVKPTILVTTMMMFFDTDHNENLLSGVCELSTGGGEGDHPPKLRAEEYFSCYTS